MMVSKKVLLTSVMLSYALSGCVYNHEMASSVQNKVSVDFDETQDALDRAKVPGRPISKDIISVSDDIWLGETSIVAEHNDPLPNRFESDEHIKAWLIVTAMNVCKTMLKHWTKQKRDDSREVIDIPDTVSEKNYELIQNILELPEKYKIVIYMYYYEGFSTSEISDFLKISESSVRSRLARGRNILKEDITLSNKEVYE